MTFLASEQFGHLGLTVKALPLVAPIRYRLLGQAIVFATGSDAELHSARLHAVACIEIAGVDRSTGAEWTVLATGRLREAEDPSTWPGDRPLPPAWGAPNAKHFIALDIELVNGCATRSQ
jgi:nitroimidazol reductase NimA-like FMN-containing flavoprotein (pyridoxamine 5'-phosphate oxidase superfamily)